MENNKKIEELVESVNALNLKLNELLCKDGTVDNAEDSEKSFVLLNDLRKEKVRYDVTTDTIKHICEDLGIDVHKIFNKTYNGCGYRLAISENDVDILLSFMDKKRLLKENDRVYLYQLEPISDYSVEVMEAGCEQLGIHVKYEKEKRGRCKQTIKRDDVLKLLTLYLKW